MTSSIVWSVSVARDADVVDHVLDQEEAPAARLLQPVELRLEVGRLGLGDLAARRPRSVIRTDELACRDGRTTTSTGSSAFDSLPCSIAFIAASDDGRLQPLEPRGSRAERRDRLGDPLARLALVPRLARDRERDVELGAAGRGRRSARTRVSATSVMSSSCSQPVRREAVELGEDAVDHLAAVRCARRRRPAGAGSRTSRASAPCASATPSEWSSIVWPGSSMRLRLLVDDVRAAGRAASRSRAARSCRRRCARTAGCGRRSRSGSGRVDGSSTP